MATPLSKSSRFLYLSFPKTFTWDFTLRKNSGNSVREETIKSVSTSFLTSIRANPMEPGYVRASWWASRAKGVVVVTYRPTGSPGVTKVHSVSWFTNSPKLRPPFCYRSYADDHFVSNRNLFFPPFLLSLLSLSALSLSLSYFRQNQCSSAH